MDPGYQCAHSAGISTEMRAEKSPHTSRFCFLALKLLTLGLDYVRKDALVLLRVKGRRWDNVSLKKRATENNEREMV